MSLYREIHGSSGNGRSHVLMSSGLGGSASYWKPQLDALVAAGWGVILYDQRGTGRSRMDLPDGYSIRHMADDVVEILDSAGAASCHFVGHALGGLVGLQLALDAPARVASLSLLNAWAAPNSHTARCFKARLSLLDAAGPESYVEAQPIFLYPAAWSVENEATIQAEVRHAIENFPGTGNLKKRIAALSQFNVEGQLGTIRAPVYISAAVDDLLVPWTQSRALAVQLAHATLEYMPQGGHAHNITHADAFNKSLLAFLSRQPH